MRKEFESADIEALQEELEHFRAEKEKIRLLIGQIGGKTSGARDRALNITFVVAISALFLIDLLRHTFHMSVPVPALFSIELGVLLVSIKIIWMIQKQTKVEHFQFWILNSIEFRLNELSRRLARIEENLE